jgi:hypothetical protein
MPLVLVALLLLAVPTGVASGKSRKSSSRPKISGFTFSPTTFNPGAMKDSKRAKRSTTITFTLSERARIRMAVSRKGVGRRVGRRCVSARASLRNRRACTRYRRVGTVTRWRLKAGKVEMSFSGRIHGRALRNGSYRATIVAIDRSGNRSVPKTATFKIGVAAQAPPAAPAPAPAPAGPGGPQRRNIRACTQTVNSTAAAQSAVAAAAPGAVICLANGTFGKLALSASKAGEVVVQSAPPAVTTIAGASLAGSHLTLEGFNITDEVDVAPGSNHQTVQFNRISGGYMGVQAANTSSTTVDDATIRANKFVGPFGEDAIRLNRYHDSDGDGVGILIEGNEITNVRENGNHSDCLQAVWVGDHLIYRRNYLHDNRCQGLFIKDQASTVDTVVADDNLMLRNAAPCDGAAGCGQPAIFQLFGPMTNLVMTRNTIWTPEGGSPTTLRNSGWGSVQVSGNVVSRFWADTSDPFGGGYSASNNVAGAREMSWPATGVTVGAPKFANPAADDYRTNDGRGVDWAPAEQQYGP